VTLPYEEPFSEDVFEHGFYKRKGRESKDEGAGSEPEGRPGESRHVFSTSKAGKLGRLVRELTGSQAITGDQGGSP